MKAFTNSRAMVIWDVSICVPKFRRRQAYREHRLVRCGDGNTGRMWDFQSAAISCPRWVWRYVHSSGMDLNG
jgi:hypothetical protein